MPSLPKSSFTYQAFFEALPLPLQNQINTLKAYLLPHTKRLYVVGGALRDFALGHEIVDLDLEVYDIAPSVFDALMKAFGASDVGKSFFVYKWQNLDIAIARSERQVDHAHTGFEIMQEQNEHLALQRRDFAMNAMMLGVYNGRFIDECQGLEALQDKTLRIANVKKFGEDALRVLRAVQFCARFGLKCSKSDVALMRQMDLSYLSSHRIVVELEKMFNARHLEYGLYYLVHLGVLQKLFGYSCDLVQWFAMCRYLKKSPTAHPLRLYYLLYVLGDELGVKASCFLQHFPKHYKMLIRQPSRRICLGLSHGNQERYLKYIALNFALKDWLGCFDGDLLAKAKALGIYHKPYVPQCSIADVMARGFKGAMIRQEYDRLAKLEIFGHETLMF